MHQNVSKQESSWLNKTLLIWYIAYIIYTRGFQYLCPWWFSAD